jgi:hypothetical protein
MTICLVDTSILLNVLDVPGRADQRPEVLAELARLNDERAELLLPFPAIIETGNHIARLRDGRGRRRCAQDFVTTVRKAIDGQAPWTVTPMLRPEDLADWLDRFPDEAMRGLGLADLVIVAEWQRQCERWPKRRVLIRFIDKEHLGGYDRNPSA